MINSDNKVNVMTLIFVAKLDLTSRPTNTDAQKIDRLPLETYDIIIVQILI